MTRNDHKGDSNLANHSHSLSQPCLTANWGKNALRSTKLCGPVYCLTRRRTQTPGRPSGFERECDRLGALLESNCTIF